MKVAYKNKNEFERRYKPGELKKSCTGYSYVNKAGNKLYICYPLVDHFDVYDVIDRTIPIPRRRFLAAELYPRDYSSMFLYGYDIHLKKTEISKEEKKEIQHLIIQREKEEKNRRASVHVLTQGSRGTKCVFYQLPNELLGEISAYIFPSSEEKLWAKIENINKNKKYDTYCGFKEL